MLHELRPQNPKQALRNTHFPPPACAPRTTLLATTPGQHTRPHPHTLSALCAQVPILVDEESGLKLIESGIIAEYLAAQFPDRGEQLMPADPLQAAKVRASLDVACMQHAIGAGLKLRSMPRPSQHRALQVSSACCMAGRTAFTCMLPALAPR